MNRLFSAVVWAFGYDSLPQFCNSLIKISSIKPMLILSGFMAALGSALGTYIGLEPVVLVSFVLLIIIEFVTGILASARIGSKIESRKIPRILIKVFFYVSILAIVNGFRGSAGQDVVGIIEHVYDFIYYAILHIVVIQLILSVLENLYKMGFYEAGGAFKFVYDKIGKYMNLEKDGSRYGREHFAESGGLYIMINNRGRVVSISPSFAILLGTPVANIIGTAFVSYFEESQQAVWNESVVSWNGSGEGDLLTVERDVEVVSSDDSRHQIHIKCRLRGGKIRASLIGEVRS